MALEPVLASVGSLPSCHHPIKATNTQQNPSGTIQRSKDLRPSSSKPVSGGLSPDGTPHGDLQNVLGARGRSMGPLRLANILNIAY